MTPVVGSQSPDLQGASTSRRGSLDVILNPSLYAHSALSPTFLLTARYLSQEPAGSHARCKLEGISLSWHLLLPNYFRQVCGCCLTPLLADRMRIAYA